MCLTCACLLLLCPCPLRVIAISEHFMPLQKSGRPQAAARSYMSFRKGGRWPGEVAGGHVASSSWAVYCRPGSSWAEALLIHRWRSSVFLVPWTLQLSSCCQDILCYLCFKLGFFVASAYTRTRNHKGYVSPSPCSAATLGSSTGHHGLLFGPCPRCQVLRKHLIL